MTPAELVDVVVKGAAPAVQHYVKTAMQQLEQRVAALERKPTPMHFCGVWVADAIYEAGAAVVHKNAVWVAKKTVQIEPDFNAQAANAWQLLVKPPPRPR